MAQLRKQGGPGWQLSDDDATLRLLPAVGEPCKESPAGLRPEGSGKGFANLPEPMNAAQLGPGAQMSPRRCYWARSLRDAACSSLVRAIGGAGWRNVALGLAGSMALAVAGPAIVSGYDGPSTRWWVSPEVPPQSGQLGNYLVAYAGMACMTLAWLGVLRRLRRPNDLRLADLVVLGSLWALPLLAGAPLFSRDIYSYLAQGMLAHLQLSPYKYPPAVLGVVGFSKLVNVVSPVWRMTTAPYGPVFLWLAGWLAGVSGGQVTAGVVLFRAAELIGIALVAACVPNIAKELGASPREALWVGALSPLVTFELLSSGHNDALMVGLLCAGLLSALKRRPLLGVALCSAATLFKLPALVGAAFIAWSWVRQQPQRRAKMAAGAASAGVAAATLLAGSALTAGFGWMSASVVLVPDKVSTPISPTQSLASLFHLVTGALGLGIPGSTISDVVKAVALVAGTAVVIALFLRAEHRTLVPSVGAAMVVLTLLGSDAWPWYLTWGLAPLAAWKPAQRSWFLVGAACLFTFVVTPAGQVAVPDAAAPGVAFVWAGLAFAFWHAHGPSGRGPLARHRSRRQTAPKRWLLETGPLPAQPGIAFSPSLVPATGSAGIEGAAALVRLPQAPGLVELPSRVAGHYDTVGINLDEATAHFEAQLAIGGTALGVDDTQLTSLQLPDIGHVVGEEGDVAPLGPASHHLGLARKERPFGGNEIHLG